MPDQNNRFHLHEAATWLAAHAQAFLYLARIRLFERFVKDRRGVSTVEYALIIVAVIGIIGAVAITLRGAFNELFNELAAELNTAVDDLASPG